MSAQQQQQQQQQQVTILDRDEIIFQTDRLFKQLVINFDLNVKKHSSSSSSSSSSGTYFDANGQQYQTIYFTLPLFLIILTIFYFKFKDLNEIFKIIKQKIDSSLGSAVQVKSNIQKSNQQQQQQKIPKQYIQQLHSSDKSSNELDTSSTSSIDVIDNEGNSISPKKVRVRKT
jgi:uncharacterized protein YnzC (UPF0291/DUF896 family)